MGLLDDLTHGFLQQHAPELQVGGQFGVSPQGEQRDAGQGNQFVFKDGTRLKRPQDNLFGGGETFGNFIQERQPQQQVSDNSFGSFINTAKEKLSSILPQVSNSTGHGYEFGQPTFYGAKHQGTDIIANPGEIITSEIGFQVTNVQVGPDGGLHVYGKDQKGNTVRFLHLGNANVKIGDMIQPGQPIGTIGKLYQYSSTEKSTAPHVHFDILDPNGKAIDPNTYS